MRVPAGGDYPYKKSPADEDDDEYGGWWILLIGIILAFRSLGNAAMIIAVLIYLGWLSWEMSREK